MGIIQNEEQKILIAKRPVSKCFGGLWEFPGGKIEHEETPEYALTRELQEELNIDIEILDSLPSYEFSNGELEIEFYPFLCRQVGSGFRANEHTEVRYTNKENLHTFTFAPPDYKVLEYLR